MPVVVELLVPPAAPLALVGDVEEVEAGAAVPEAVPAADPIPDAVPEAVPVPAHAVMARTQATGKSILIIFDPL